MEEEDDQHESKVLLDVKEPRHAVRRLPSSPMDWIVDVLGPLLKAFLIVYLIFTFLLCLLGYRFVVYGAPMYSFWQVVIMVRAHERYDARRRIVKWMVVSVIGGVHFALVDAK